MVNNIWALQRIDHVPQIGGIGAELLLNDRAKSKVMVRRAKAEDIATAAEVHRQAFPRQTYSKEWLECVFRAFPKSQLFVAEIAGDIVGIIFWTEKSGFRKDAVLELEQIAVYAQDKDVTVGLLGIGTQLIRHSLPLVAQKIAERGAKIGFIIGSTRVNNRALKLYKRFGAELMSTIPGMFSADEGFVVVRDVDAKIVQALSREPNLRQSVMS